MHQQPNFVSYLPLEALMAVAGAYSRRNGLRPDAPVNLVADCTSIGVAGEDLPYLERVRESAALLVDGKPILSGSMVTVINGTKVHDVEVVVSWHPSLQAEVEDLFRRSSINLLLAVFAGGLGLKAERVDLPGMMVVHLRQPAKPQSAALPVVFLPAEAATGPLDAPLYRHADGYQPMTGDPLDDYGIHNDRPEDDYEIDVVLLGLGSEPFDVADEAAFDDFLRGQVPADACNSHCPNTGCKSHPNNAVRRAA
jgi:hypothetical protein